jgi:hypothetical protein
MLRCIIRALSKEPLLELEERVKNLEFIFAQGTQDIVREVQIEFLKDLHEIKRSIENESKINENNEVEEELKSLREENLKLKYRIAHLKAHIP